MPSYELIFSSLLIVLSLAYFFVFKRSPASASTPAAISTVSTDDSSDPRNFILKLQKQKRRLVIFYGSQTGTAEEYAIRIAKEAKSKFGLGSLVCDPEEYDIEHLDEVPSDCVVVFVMATYGEGDPTDNALKMTEDLICDEPTFTNGSRLDNLKYVVFGSGNKTYEHFNAVAKKYDEQLTKLGGRRIGPVGLGDDDKALEEDYLSWKDLMWADLAVALHVEEGATSIEPDFKITEIPEMLEEKVYRGELSQRSLMGTKGIHDQKNPFPAPVAVARELFQLGAGRNCVHLELDITDAGINYSSGDHVALWPLIPDVEVDRILSALGLSEKRHTAVSVESLDPALAKVPFPSPTTYDSIFRHYLDIMSPVSRQTLATLAKYAPTQQAQEMFTRLGSDKEYYHHTIVDGFLNLGSALQLATGGLDQNPTIAWPDVPLDVIVSSLSRLQPRFYSISSSPKYHPNSIHVTAVVVKWQTKSNPKFVYGLVTNYVLNLQMAMNGKSAPVNSQPRKGLPAAIDPVYNLSGPRGKYHHDGRFKIPVHVRRSAFRLPTSPKIPIVMIGPGTGVAPFRGFIQDRVALARRAKEKNGATALKDWAPMYLFYGCRKSAEDFLYREEWDSYIEELEGHFQMFTAFSREGNSSGASTPAGKKIYVQDIIQREKANVARAILDMKGQVYICGDKTMGKQNEEILMQILGEYKGGTAKKEGAAEVKLLKDRNRLSLDVW